MSDPERIRNLAVVLTARCNLRCSYCYQNAKKPLSMTWDTLRSCLNLALGSPNREMDILFLGGEPLLEFPMMRRAVEYFENRCSGEKSLTFRISTNGTLLTDEILAFLEEHHFNLQLSFDGIDKAQDFRGKSTFEILDRLLDRMRNEHTDFFRWRSTICITITPANVVHLPASVDYFLAKGVQKILIAPSLLSYPSWRIDDIEKLDALFRLVFESSLRHWRETGKIPVFSFRNKYEGAPRAPRERPMCGVVSGLTFAVDVDGHAYACTTIAGSYQNFPSPFMRDGLRGMHLGGIGDPGFLEHLASFPETARGVEMFSCKAKKYSAYGRCGECAYLSVCSVCPVSIAHVRGNTDPNRVSDFCCAYNRVSLKYRERFPAQPSPRDRVRGPAGAADEMTRWKALAAAHEHGHK